jgi:hypothetical protein
MKPKTKDILVLVCINIFAIVISFAFQTNFLTSTILFLGLPSLYLLYQERGYFRKIFLASISFGVFFGFGFDFIAELNKAWDWNSGLLFGKIFGVVQVDVLFWFFLWVFHIFLFYEHFIDRVKLVSTFSKRGILVFTVSLLSIPCLIIVYKLYPSLLYFDKAYLTLCIIVSIPFLITCFVKPRLVLHTLPMMPYFFFVYITHEITALHLHQWRFPGDYIGQVSMVGVSFPIEELVFWIILSSLIGAMYYELSFDNQKN